MLRKQKIIQITLLMLLILTLFAAALPTASADLYNASDVPSSKDFMTTVQTKQPG